MGSEFENNGVESYLDALSNPQIATIEGGKRRKYKKAGKSRKSRRAGKSRKSRKAGKSRKSRRAGKATCYVYKYVKKPCRKLKL